MVFKTNYRLMQEHSAILSTFIKLSFVIKIFVLSIFEWPFYTGFAVGQFMLLNSYYTTITYGNKKEESDCNIIRTPLRTNK